MEKAMTVISPRPTTVYVPKPASTEPSTSAPGSAPQDAGKTAGQLREERAEADALKQIERVQTIMEVMQETVKKMTAERMKKFDEETLSRLEESLSKPAEEAEKLSANEADNVKKIAEDMFRAAGYENFFSSPGTVIFGLDGWQYNFYKDGTATRKRQGILTPDQVQSTRENAATLKSKLSGGAYDTQIEQSQKRVETLFEQLGALSEQEKAFLGGFGSLTRGNISLTA